MSAVNSLTEQNLKSWLCPLAKNDSDAMLSCCWQANEQECDDNILV